MNVRDIAVRTVLSAAQMVLICNATMAVTWTGS